MSAPAEVDASGVTRVALPIGVNAIESVNMYVLPDGDKVTVVDCGVWRPDLPDGGLAAMEAGLEGAGYALADVARVDRHPRAHRPLRAGRPGDGADRCRPGDAHHDGPGLREVPPPRHRPRPPPRHVRRPRRLRGRARRPRRPPHPVAALPAFRRRGLTRLRGEEELEIGGETWQVIHTPGHSLGHVCLYPRRTGLCCSGDHLLPGITPPVTFERGFDADPMRSYLHRCGRSRTCGHARC